MKTIYGTIGGYHILENPIRHSGKFQVLATPDGTFVHYNDKSSHIMTAIIQYTNSDDIEIINEKAENLEQFADVLVLNNHLLNDYWKNNPDKVFER